MRRAVFILLAVVAVVGAACTSNPGGGGGGNNKSPVAVAAANPGSTSMEIAFSSASSYDPDGTIVGYSWSFGDGSADSTDANPTHLYLSANTFVATLTVTDNLGATQSAQVSVTVPVTPNQPPVAVGSATPNQGPAPLAVQFTSTSYDPEGGPIASYLWDFGDGITSNQQNPTHTFTALGDFDVTLKVTDQSGAEGQTTVPVSTWEAQISNASTARCVDLDNGNTGNGAWVLSYPCTGGANQRWVIEPNGRISTGINAAKCLDALGTGALGTNVGIYDCNGGLNQRWAPVNGTLVNDANDLCLAAKNAGVAPKTQLVLATCNPADEAQQWAVAKWQKFDSQRLRNTAVDRCVGVQGNTLANNRAIADWTCVDDTTMAWYLDPNGYMLNRAEPSWCMDGNGGTLGKQVVLYQCGETQTWQRWHVSGSQLVNDTNNLCLARSASNDLPGSNMALANCDPNSAAQQFAFEAPGPWAWQQIRNTSPACAPVSPTPTTEPRWAPSPATPTTPSRAGTSTPAGGSSTCGTRGATAAAPTATTAATSATP